MSIFDFLPKTIFKGRPTSSIHQFTVKTLDGKPLQLNTFAGKKIMVVNTASECGLTHQFKELESLYEKYKSKNFVVIGFPCNDFGAQEPGSHQEIGEFCQRNYGVTFPMMEKVGIKPPNTAPVYEWLTHKKMNGVMSSNVKWNFQKYLIDERGFLVDCLIPLTSPLNSKITNWIERPKS